MTDTNVFTATADEIVKAYNTALNGKHCMWIAEPDAKLLNMNAYPLIAGLTSLHMINSHDEWTAQFCFYDFVYNNHVAAKTMQEAVDHFVDVLDTTIRAGCATELARVAAVRDGSASSNAQ